MPTVENLGNFHYDAVSRPWHGTGTWGEGEIYNASQLTEKLGVVGVTKRPLYYKATDGTFREIKRERAAVLSSWSEDGTFHPEKWINNVNKSYHIIESQRFASILDSVVQRNLATCGQLADGTIFYSYQMKEYEIVNDTMREYFVVLNPANGVHPYRIITTQTRVVCQNTMNAAIQNARLRLSIRHNKSAEEQLEGWMAWAWQQQIGVSAEIEKAFNSFTEVPMSTADAAEEYLREVFKAPKEPKFNPVQVQMKANQERYEQELAFARGQRQKSMLIWQKRLGREMQGQDPHDCKAWDTLWGVYNAAVETIEYGGRRGKHFATSTLMGGKVKDQEKAFEVAYAIANP